MSNYLLADLLSALKNHINSDIGVSFKFPFSGFCVNVLSVLKSSGYIANYEVMDAENNKKYLVVYPLFNPRSLKNMFSAYKLISKPGVRRYINFRDLKNQVLVGRTRIFILSTSKGVLSSEEAIKMNVGGELLCVIL